MQKLKHVLGLCRPVAKASYLFVGTYSNGPQTGSVALARIGGTGKLYKEAMENLKKEVGNFEL